MIKVTMADLREAKLCASGAREWCQRYGFDFRELVRDGLPADAVAETQDQFGLAVAKLAMQRANSGR